MSGVSLLDLYRQLLKACSKSDATSMKESRRIARLIVDLDEQAPDYVRLVAS